MNREKRIMDELAPVGVFVKACTICGKTFETNRKIKEICSHPCRMQHNREHSRMYARLRRNNKKKKVCPPCIICGFSITTDQHSEKGKKYTLCPNHHCMITRGITTLEKLLLVRDSF